MQTQQESSVLFNLQELMRIEQDRVESEASAERALRAQALERERRQAEEAARQLAQTRAIEQEAQQQQQRQTQEAQAAAARALQLTLEQTRVELELAAKTEQARLLRAHELSLAQIEAKSAAPWTRQALVVFAVVGALIAAGYFGVVEPLLAQSRALEAETRALAQSYAAQIEALRQTPVEEPRALAPATAAGDVESTGSSAAPDVQGDTARATGATKTKRRVTTRDAPRGERQSQHSPAHVLDPLDSDDDDPLKGL